MNGTTYVVTLQLQTQGAFSTQMGKVGQQASQAHSQVTSLGHAFSRVGDVVERIGGRVGGALEGVADTVGGAIATVGKLAGAAGLGLAAYGVAKLNNNLEQTQISLGAIAQAQGFASTFEQGFTAAGDQLQKMKQDVKSLPGDLGQLSDLMKMIATPAAQGGAGLDQIRKLAGQTMLTSTILGVPQEVASREMANLLAGRAGAHNILGSRMGLIGDEAQKFNKSSASDRLTRINAEMDKYQGASDRFAHSFVAQWTTLKDNIKYSMLAPATTGLFERVTHGISEANDYLDEHKDKVAEIASLINRRLVAAWDAGENALKKYGPLLGKYADMIAHMQPAEIGQKLEKAGKMLLAAKVGGMAISGGSSMLGGGIRMLGGIGGIEGIGAGLSAVAAAMPVIGAAALPAAAMLGMVAGAVDILTDKSSIYHDQAVELGKQIGDNLSRSFEMVKPSIDHAESSLRAFGDYMGLGLMQDVAAGTNALVAFGNMLKYITPGQGPGDRDWDIQDVFNRSKDIPGALPDRAGDGLPHLVRMDKTSLGPVAEALSKKGGGGGGGGTNIGKVEIRVEGAGDPSRIARLVMGHVEKLARNPKASPYVADYVQDHASTP
jgi:hypothetical protein